MTIEQIIKELEKERDYDIAEYKDRRNSPVCQEYFKGKAYGIKYAIMWLKYLKNKEGV